MPSWWRRAPQLLGPDDLPAGFAYPPELSGLVAGRPLGRWEWLSGERLSKASTNLWRHHPRHLVPIAVRRDTTFVVCLDHSRVGPQGHEVVTIDALDAEAPPVQHLPSLAAWVEAASEEESGPPVPAPGEGWEPPQPGRCGCVHHLDGFALRPVPYGSSAPTHAPPRTVADLMLAEEIVVEPDHPGPEVAWRGRPVGPFHWRVHLGQGARLHLDDDGRVPLDQWLMQNPGVGLVTWPDHEALHLMAPTLCREGVQTLVARALLDDRVRRR